MRMSLILFVIQENDIIGLNITNYKVYVIAGRAEGRGIKSKFSGTTNCPSTVLVDSVDVVDNVCFRGVSL